MSEAHEHLEHAEHAEHAAHSTFDRKVAVTVAIIAAVLAGVAMLGHRKHNDTLIHKTVKGQLEVKESNTWAQYQSKRLRQQMDILQIQTLTRLPREKGPDADPDVSRLKAEVARYETELADLKKQAEGVQAEVKKADAEANHTHHQADWLDYAHLAVELGLVVCSLGHPDQAEGVLAGRDRGDGVRDRAGGLRADPARAPRRVARARGRGQVAGRWRALTARSTGTGRAEELPDAAR